MKKFKLILTAALLLGVFMPVKAQNHMHLGSRKSPPIVGWNGQPNDMDGKYYQANIKTPITNKKEVVQKVIDLLRESGIEIPTNKIDEIDDATSEFSERVYMRTNCHLVKFMGINVYCQPARIDAKIRFEFVTKSDGSTGVGISFTDLDADAFFITDGKTLTPGEDFIKNNPEVKKYEEFRVELMNKNMGLVKLLNMASAVIDPFNYKKNIEEFYKRDMLEEYAMYERVEKEGTGRWLTDEEYMEIYANSNYAGKDVSLNIMKQYLSENRVLPLTQERWEEQTRPIMDMFFKSMCAVLQGEITAIMEDDKFTWVNTNLEELDSALYKANITLIPQEVLKKYPKMKGKVVPTDPKEQKKYLSSGKEF